MCASIPFARNLIEYTKGDKDADYLILTRLLHWKNGTMDISVMDFFDIYNRLFNTAHVGTDKLVFDVLFDEAKRICHSGNHFGLNLEDKVLLSIAIRLRAEQFLINQARVARGDPNYWCELDNQFGVLIKEYKKSQPDPLAKRILEKVSITVSSNIHLNSFMYEPILDLTIGHLVKLYVEVDSL